MSAGLTFGAFFWGIAVDLVGRRIAYNSTVLITCVFVSSRRLPVGEEQWDLCLNRFSLRQGSLVAASENYATACAMFALCGFGLGGQIPIDATISEFRPCPTVQIRDLLT